MSILVPFLIVLLVAYARSRWWLMTPWAALPLAGALLVRVYRSEGASLNRCLAMCGALQWAFGLLFVAGAALG